MADDNGPLVFHKRPEKPDAARAHSHSHPNQDPNRKKQDEELPHRKPPL